MLKKLENFLDKKKIKYKLVKHRKVYTAYDAAATQHVDLKCIVKCLLVKADSDFVLIVLPAHKKLDTVKLKKLINKERKKNEEKTVKKLKICSETVIKNNVTKGKGAIPPFGSLYGFETYVDQSLMKQKKINMNAGSFTESIEMTPAQYKKAEVLIVGSIGKS